MRSLTHLCTLMLILWAWTLCFFTKNACLHRTMNTFRAKKNRTYGLACPSPSKRACIGRTPTTDQCAASSTTHPGGPSLALIYKQARISRPAIRKLIRSFKFMCRVVIDSRCGQARYVLNLACDFQHITLLFVTYFSPHPPICKRSNFCIEHTFLSHMSLPLLFAIAFFNNC